MTDQTPPVAQRKPVTRRYHGTTRDDPYDWLYDRGYPEVTDTDVLDYLKAENAYFDAWMAPHKALKGKLFEELKGRIKDDDRSVPVIDGAYAYQWRFEEGAEYRRWYRWPAAGDDEQEVLIFDEPARAQGHDHYNLRALEQSPDDRRLAFSEDVDGSERYVIRVKAAEDDALLPDEVANTSGALVWAADGSGFFYVELSPELRPFRVRFRSLGQKTDDDPVIYEERDDSFFVGIGRSQSRKYLKIAAGDHVTTEVRLVPLAEPQTAPRIVLPRVTNREYDVDHAEDRLFIRINDLHKNFRIVEAPERDAAPDNWRELIAGDDRRYVRGFVSFKTFLAVEERVDGLDQILIHPLGKDAQAHHVALPEQTYAVALGSNPAYDPAHLRIAYQSMVTPPTVYDYDLAAKTLATRKVLEIPSGYDKTRYRTERLMAPGRDGTLIPVSIVYPKDFKKGSAAPLHLYGYGAYGLGMAPSFSTARISLLDRGFAYAIAHIRGGDEMGYHWYEAGKRERRKNAFNDFIDVAKFLIDEGYAATGEISISGGSAGGTLMGVAANEAPELWRAVVAHVPFVDVLGTMLNDKLPLTPIEWPEWGNPIEDAEAFALIKSYSPYENVAAQAYPPMLVTAGLNDPRVTYWEPAKWVAKLRATKTDDSPLLFKINMGSGHGGKSGRYQRLEEVAEEYLFILAAFGRMDE